MGVNTQGLSDALKQVYGQTVASLLNKESALFDMLNGKQASNPVRDIINEIRREHGLPAPEPEPPSRPPFFTREPDDSDAFEVQFTMTMDLIVDNPAQCARITDISDE